MSWKDKFKEAERDRLGIEEEEETYEGSLYAYYKGMKKAGSYKAIWNGRGNYGQEVTSGVYFLHLRAGDVKLTRKLLLVR